jgi:hypothetical protein
MRCHSTVAIKGRLATRSECRHRHLSPQVGAPLPPSLTCVGRRHSCHFPFPRRSYRAAIVSSPNAKPKPSRADVRTPPLLASVDCLHGPPPPMSRTTGPHRSKRCRVTAEASTLSTPWTPTGERPLPQSSNYRPGASDGVTSCPPITFARLSSLPHCWIQADEHHSVGRLPRAVPRWTWVAIQSHRPPSHPHCPSSMRRLGLRTLPLPCHWSRLLRRAASTAASPVLLGHQSCAAGLPLNLA